MGCEYDCVRVRVGGHGWDDHRHKGGDALMSLDHVRGDNMRLPLRKLRWGWRGEREDCLLVCETQTRSVYRCRMLLGLWRLMRDERWSCCSGSDGLEDVSEGVLSVHDREVG